MAHCHDVLRKLRVEASDCAVQVSHFMRDGASHRQAGGSIQLDQLSAGQIESLDRRDRVADNDVVLRLRAKRQFEGVSTLEDYAICQWHDLSPVCAGLVTSGVDCELHTRIRRVSHKDS